MASGAEVTSGGLLQVGLAGFGAGGVVSDATIDSGGFESVDSGGTDFGASVSGTLQIFSSGLASGVEVRSGGLLQVGLAGFAAGGVVSDATIDSTAVALSSSIRAARILARPSVAPFRFFPMA